MHVTYNKMHDIIMFPNIINKENVSYLQHLNKGGQLLAQMLKIYKFE